MERPLTTRNLTTCDDRVESQDKSPPQGGEKEEQVARHELSSPKKQQNKVTPNCLSNAGCNSRKEGGCLTQVDVDIPIERRKNAHLSNKEIELSDWVRYLRSGIAELLRFPQSSSHFLFYYVMLAAFSFYLLLCSTTLFAVCKTGVGTNTSTGRHWHWNLTEYLLSHDLRHWNIHCLN